jgi:hypothetical protein
LTPRHDVASYFPKGKFRYLTLARILSAIVRAGKGCLLTQFDARDAYKQLLVRFADLNQQVFKAGGKFYVDFCASFGSLYGNDSYSAFAFAHCVCLAVASGCPLLWNYVDNYLNITPYTGKTTEARARIELLKIKVELLKSGLLFHQFEGPVAVLTFLGWEINTNEMTVSITETRRSFMIDFLREWEKKATYSIKDLSSLIGLLIFLSQLIGGIKATIGILIIKRTDMTRSSCSSSFMSERIRAAVSHILYVLNRWGGTAKILTGRGKRGERTSRSSVISRLTHHQCKQGPLGRGLLPYPRAGGSLYLGRRPSWQKRCGRKNIRLRI